MKDKLYFKIDKLKKEWQFLNDHLNAIHNYIIDAKCILSHSQHLIDKKAYNASLIISAINDAENFLIENTLKKNRLRDQILKCQEELEEKDDIFYSYY